MLLFFRRKTNIIHFHLTVFDVAKQVGVVAVNKIWEVDYLVRLLIPNLCRWPESITDTFILLSSGVKVSCMW